MEDLKNSPAAEEEQTETLTPEQGKEIVKQELMELPEADRKAVGEIIKDTVLIRINNHKKRLGTFKRKFSATKIPDVDLSKMDLLEIIKDARREMRNFRVPITKEKLEVTKPMRDGTALINGKYDPLIQDTKKLESPWDEAQDKWEKAIEDKRKADAEAKEKILLDRIKRLEGENCAFDGAYYILESREFEIPAISFGIADLQTMSDELYEDMFVQVQQKNALIQEKLEAKKAEETRLENLRLENEKLAKQKLIDDQKKVDEEKLRLAQEQEDIANEKREMRTHQLITMGLTQTGEKFSYEGKHVILEDLASYSAADWAATKQTLKEKIEALETKQKAEAWHKITIEARTRDLTALGFSLMDNGKVYGYKGRPVVMAHTLGEPEEAWEGLVTWAKGKIAEIDAEPAPAAPPVIERPTRTVSGPSVAEAEGRRDLAKWTAFVATLKVIEYPAMETDSYKELINQVQQYITGLK